MAEISSIGAVQLMFESVDSGLIYTELLERDVVTTEANRLITVDAAHFYAYLGKRKWDAQQFCDAVKQRAEAKKAARTAREMSGTSKLAASVKVKKPTKVSTK